SRSPPRPPADWCHLGLRKSRRTRRGRCGAHRRLPVRAGRSHRRTLMSTDSGLPLIMGIVNVTPDSFSDGGRYLDHAAAIAHGRRLVEEGADIVDVGGESTRPGAQLIDAATEIDRVLG